MVNSRARALQAVPGIATNLGRFRLRPATNGHRLNSRSSKDFCTLDGLSRQAIRSFRWPPCELLHRHSAPPPKYCADARPTHESPNLRDPLRIECEPHEPPRRGIGARTVRKFLLP